MSKKKLMLFTGKILVVEYLDRELNQNIKIAYKTGMSNISQALEELIKNVASSTTPSFAPNLDNIVSMQLIENVEFSYFDFED